VDADDCAIPIRCCFAFSRVEMKTNCGYAADLPGWKDTIRTLCSPSDDVIIIFYDTTNNKHRAVYAVYW
jgi:hypothetical protein